MSSQSATKHPEKDRTRAPQALAFTAPVLGMILVGALDAVVGTTCPGSMPESWAARAGYTLMILGHAALVGLVAGTAVALVTLLGRLPVAVRFRGLRLGLDFLVIWLAFTAFMEWANLTLFDGPKISRAPYTPVLRWAQRILLPVGTLIAGVFLAHHLARASRGQASRTTSALGVVALFAAACLVAVNLHKYRGLYPYIHLQEVVVAGALATVGLILLPIACSGGWLSGLQGRLGALLLALALIAGSFWARSSDDYMVVKAAVAARAAATSEWSGSTRPLFDLIYKPPPMQLMRVDDLLADLKSMDRKEIARRLDATLPNRRSFNVLWIAMDTVRADHCSFLDYKKPTTPNLDKLAQDAFVFSRAYTPYPTSNFAYSSVLTSLAPRVTPAYKYYKKKDWTYPKHIAFPSLASDAGIKTYGITAFDRDTATRLDWFGSMREGFQVYNPDQTISQSKAPEINASASNLLRSITDHQWFLFIQYLDPHNPYRPHEGFDLGKGTIGLYDGEIAYTDDHVGRLLDLMSDLGLMQNTVIVVFSDHGEEFREHGAFYHNSNVYEQQIHVPLLVFVPGLKGRRIDKAVNLMDVVPTMTDLLGLADPVERMGRSLLPMMLGAPNQHGYSYSEYFGWGAGKHVRDQRALIYDDLKLVLRPQQDAWELFRVADDPLERHTLVQKEPESVRKLMALIKAEDRRIDGYHSSGASRVSDPKAEFLQQIEVEVAAIETSDHTQGVPHVVALGKLIWNAFYDLTPEASRWLGSEGLHGVFDRILQRHKTTHPAILNRVLLYLGYARVERYGAAFKVFLQQQSGFFKVTGAMGLGRIGDATGQEVLRQALRNPRYGNKPMIAIALARLGDPASVEWMCRNLVDIHRPILTASLREMSRVPLPATPARVVRDLMTSSRYQSPEVHLALLEALAEHRDPDAVLLMLRLLQNKEEVTRAAARKLLTGFMSPADIETESRAISMELEGDVALANRIDSLAVRHYRGALETGALYNSGLRLRLARAHVLAGEIDEARKVLKEVASASDVPQDRALALRRIAQVEAPVQLNPGELGVEIDITRMEVPERILRFNHFVVKVPLKNTSPHALHGGMWKKGVWLSAHLKGADGKLIPASRVYENWLPEEGLDPGEERLISLVGVAPRAAKDARIVVVLHQDAITLENDGIIAEHATAYTY